MTLYEKYIHPYQRLPDKQKDIGMTKKSIFYEFFEKGIQPKTTIIFQYLSIWMGFGFFR